MYRVEDKYICSKRDMLYLDARLKTVLRTDDNQKNNDGYTITSVYFDDYQDQCLVDTVQGKQIREKYRIRIYNKSFSMIKLEVKHKRNNRVQKRSRKITYEQMISLMAGECIEDDSPSLDNAITLFNLAISQRKIKPVVIVEYERRAYIFDAGNVRITIDRNIRYSKEFDFFITKRPYLCTEIESPSHVLEVKYDEFLPGFIAGILEIGNMQQNAFSKYRLCREGAMLCQ